MQVAQKHLACVHPTRPLAVTQEGTMPCKEACTEGAYWRRYDQAIMSARDKRQAPKGTALSHQVAAMIAFAMQHTRCQCQLQQQTMTLSVQGPLHLAADLKQIT